MSDAARDLDDYAVRYRAMPYEPLQAAVRRERVLRQVAARAPVTLVEVGCGEVPLFTDVTGPVITVVEPAARFAAVARAAARGRPEVRVVEAAIEAVTADDLAGPVDMVLVSSLLHEVADPAGVLAAVRELCGPTTTVHVNVPNALSLHRRLAVAMGLAADPAEISPMQRAMQQHSTYDRSSLTAEVERAGFEVVDGGGIALKPFTHAQMQHLVDAGFLSPPVLAGLALLGEDLPDLASEVWVDVRPSTR